MFGKKFLSAAIAAAMLGACAVSALAAETASGVTKVEFEDQPPTLYGAPFGVSENEAASGGKWVQYLGAAANDETASLGTCDTKVTVSERGLYELKFRGTKSDGSLSNVSFSANGKDAISLVNAATADAQNVTAGGWFGTTIYTQTGSALIPLEAGENDIKFRISSRPQNDYYVIMDYYTVEKKEELPSVKATGTSVLEAEYLFGNSSPFEAASGGAYIVNYAENTESVTLSGVIYADQAGIYKLSYDGTNPSVSDRLMSPLTFTINGKTLSAAQAGAFKYTSGMGSPWNVHSNILPAVSLNKGKNTIEIKATRAEAFGPGTNNVFFVLDNLTFESTLQTIGLSGGTIECEDYTQSSVAADGASGGRYVEVNREGQDCYFTLDTYVNIETAGNYQISVGAADRWAKTGADAGYGTATHLSPFHVIVGDSDILVDLSNSTRSNKLNYAGFTGAIVNLITLKNSFHFDEGLNKITVQFDPRNGNDGVFGSLDCIKLSYGDTLPAEGGKLEIESGNGVNGYVLESTAASDGKYVAFDEANTDNAPEINLTVNLAQAGNYQLKLAAAANVGSDQTAALTKAQIAINQGDTYNLDESSIAAGSVYYLDSEEKYPFREYYLSTPVALVEGANTITIYPYAEDESFVRSAYDYLEIKPVADFGTITAAETDISMNVGEEKQMELKKEDGSILNASDVYMITYSSNNEEAATVDGNGVITANNGGNAVISAVVRENAITDPKTVTINVTVTDSRTIYFSGINTADGISYQVVVNQAMEKDAKAYTAVYDAQGRLVAAKADTIKAGTTGTTPVSFGTSIPEGGALSLYVWTADMTPIIAANLK